MIEAGMILFISLCILIVIFCFAIMLAVPTFDVIGECIENFYEIRTKIEDKRRHRKECSNKSSSLEKWNSDYTHIFLGEGNCMDGFSKKGG